MNTWLFVFQFQCSIQRINQSCAAVRFLLAHRLSMWRPQYKLSPSFVWEAKGIYPKFIQLHEWVILKVTTHCLPLKMHSVMRAPVLHKHVHKNACFKFDSTEFVVLVSSKWDYTGLCALLHRLVWLHFLGLRKAHTVGGSDKINIPFDSCFQYFLLVFNFANNSIQSIQNLT